MLEAQLRLAVKLHTVDLPFALTEPVGVAPEAMRKPEDRRITRSDMTHMIVFHAFRHKRDKSQKLS